MLPEHDYLYVTRVETLKFIGESLPIEQLPAVYANYGGGKYAIRVTGGSLTFDEVQRAIETLTVIADYDNIDLFTEGCPFL